MGEEPARLAPPGRISSSSIFERLSLMAFEADLFRAAVEHISTITPIQEPAPAAGAGANPVRAECARHRADGAAPGRIVFSYWR